MNKKLILNKKLIGVSLLLMVISLGVIFGDSNGIWNLAKDLRFGELGKDEIGYGNNAYFYIFNNPVRFLKNISSNFSVNGYIFQNGHRISTLDNTGKVPLSQLPFHKGDLLSPANRLSIGGIDDYYFDITNLDINKTSLIAKKVADGVSFGLNNNIKGTFTSDANAVSKDIFAGKSAYVKGVKIQGTLYKGYLLSPNNRLSVPYIYNYYFDISNLEINKNSLIAKKVADGVSFGLNNNIKGTFTSDANAVSNKILVGNSAYVKGVKIEGTLSLDSVCSSAGVGGTASCNGGISTIEPGTFYTLIGSNSPTNTNYCEKIDVKSDGTIQTSIINSAGICKKVTSCNSASQSISNYPDGTICGNNKECKSGSCIVKKISPANVNLGSVYPTFSCAVGWDNGYVKIYKDGIEISTTAMYADYVKNEKNYRSYVNFPLTNYNYPIINYKNGRDNIELKVDPNSGNIVGRCKSNQDWFYVNTICPYGKFDGRNCVLH